MISKTYDMTDVLLKITLYVFSMMAIFCVFMVMVYPIYNNYSIDKKMKILDFCKEIKTMEMYDCVTFITDDKE